MSCIHVTKYNNAKYNKKQCNAKYNKKQWGLPGQWIWLPIGYLRKF